MTTRQWDAPGREVLGQVPEGAGHIQAECAVLTVERLGQQVRNRSSSILLAAIERTVCEVGGVAVGADGQHAAGRHQQPGLERPQVRVELAMGRSSKSSPSSV
ncbi:hypothetical protein OG800_49310 (plasmid) [Streptomyces sp. NBC_00445]|uniref:hypothetical protein n=1 Tax=Streptomyces sp. NBC_00445 TaxID=2975745 RepID=UPI002E21D2F7